MRQRADLAGGGRLAVDVEALPERIALAHVCKQEGREAVGQRGLADALRTGDEPAVMHAAGGEGVHQCALGRLVAVKHFCVAGMREALEPVGLGQRLDLLRCGSARHQATPSRAETADQTRAATVSMSPVASITTQRPGSRRPACESRHARRSEIAARAPQSDPLFRMIREPGRGRDRNRQGHRESASHWGHQSRRRAFPAYRWPWDQALPLHPGRRGRIRETIRDHDLASDESRADDSIEMIGASGVKEKGFRESADAAVWRDRGSAGARFRRRRSPPAPGSATLAAERAQALAEDTRLGGLARPLAALERDEHAAFRRARRHASHGPWIATCSLRALWAGPASVDGVA